MRRPRSQDLVRILWDGWSEQPEDDPGDEETEEDDGVVWLEMVVGPRGFQAAA